MKTHNHEGHNHHKYNHEGHNHGKSVVLTNVNNAFIIGIVLNLVYVIIQIIIGLRINSLSLLSDAGHNFLDVAGLALSLLAFKLTKAKASSKYTYGYKKSSILISLINAVVLLISIGAIGYEAIFRFQNPQPIPGLTIAIVSAIGIFINGISAFMFFREKDKDINVKSAFLHLMADALVSLALVVGGIIIYYTHLYWIDPVLSLLVCGVIIASTWNLLKESFRLSLDGVPSDVNIQDIREIALKIKGVEEIHHLHVWAISTTENALTAHIIVNENETLQNIHTIKEGLKHELQHHNIHHITIETETKNNDCDEKEC
jgi:cobalt-zinc-cadmium efflux system protein